MCAGQMTSRLDVMSADHEVAQIADTEVRIVDRYAGQQSETLGVKHQMDTLQ